MSFDALFAAHLPRKVLYAVFAGGTVLLAGSSSPEKLTMPKTPERPAVKEVLAMTPELPLERQEAWTKAAGQDALTLFRLTCTGR